ncbi:glycine cleavage system aminomethyltransferase GcvT [Nocardioides ochotonae]|uniref:glycine cleavage system aminomethyltransferase GcvT n=1 Tax=Nocardioides ochotonae TaxID=2685869 RepID=UPI001409BC6D|nr:glycine cleavage system aminomethyltransferase GcvT [Nocardioides ochotonae]
MVGTTAPLLRSPLHERHTELGAKFAEFGGWSMPLEYPTGVVKEHQAVRTGVGLFDVSHLGKLVVRGPGAAAYLNSVLTNDLDRIRPGQAQYTLCCEDATGGIVDDLIVYLRGDDEVLLVPNASNSAEVERRLAAQAPPGVEVVDEHRDHVVLAVQGPESDEVLTELGMPVGHDYMSFALAPFRGERVVVCRSGYTGERGYELIAPYAVAVPLWDALLEAGHRRGIVPCGLGARDTLRTEMGYPLHGQDITLDTTPVQARLAWAVGWDKPSFWGREALLAERAAGPSRVLRGIVAAGRGIPRPGMTVSEGPDAAGDSAGEVTSGTFSPTLRKGVGLAYLAPHVKVDAEVGVDVRGRREAFVVTKPPFVQPSVREV